MPTTVFQLGDLPFQRRSDEDARQVAPLSDALASSRASVWRYAPGCKGRRHAEKVQEEVFVVVDGTLTIDLGEPPVRHRVQKGGVVVVAPGDPLQLRNEGDEELVLVIYGASGPQPERGADFFPDVP